MSSGKSERRLWRCPSCGQQYRIPASADDPRVCKKCASQFVASEETGKGWTADPELDVAPSVDDGMERSIHDSVPVSMDPTTADVQTKNGDGKQCVEQHEGGAKRRPRWFADTNRITVALLSACVIFLAASVTMQGVICYYLVRFDRTSIPVSMVEAVPGAFSEALPVSVENRRPIRVSGSVDADITNFSDIDVNLNDHDIRGFEPIPVSIESVDADIDVKLKDHGILVPIPVRIER